MNLRPALYALARVHGLDRAATARLFALAQLEAEPPQLQRGLWRAVAVLGAALAGFGVILWLAANWDALGRLGRFALLQGFVLAMALGAWLRAAARPALGLLALLGVGGLFAAFGQTYQTGADPWQLFGLWALLGLPLCLGARSDVLWMPWTLVVAAAISLWTHAHVGHRWQVSPQDWLAYLIAWTAFGLLIASLSRAGARWTGAGPWSRRSAVTLACAMVSFTAIGALFHRPIAAHYGLALLLFVLAAALLAQRRWFDVYGLSAVLLCIDTLLVAGLVRALFDHRGGDLVGALLLTGLVAAGLLAASVHWVLRLAARSAGTGAPVADPRGQA